MATEQDYEAFFRRATGYDCYPYQAKLALAESMPSRLSVPTGLGKTAAVSLAWLWRRRFSSGSIRQRTPRRLVYCLPMRVLVEQTRDNIVTWLHRLNHLAGAAEFEGGTTDRLASYDPYAAQGNGDGVRVHILMGGETDRDWDREPERDAVIVGTQDMILSRALNRGYGMSRFRWPLQFGLLNNDSLWVLDEVQLMGSGLATTAQLQAFRRGFGTMAPVRSLWMSATMRSEWLETVDFDLAPDAPGELEIGDDDKGHPKLKPRFEAVKRLERVSFSATDGGEQEAALALEQHKAGTRTIVVVNTVKRAKAVFEKLKKKRPRAELALVHSRFRPQDRETQLARLLAPPGEHGTIGVCTQVVEAGVDVSARVLVTDLAPWASLVQRFGRCNRQAEHSDAAVLWIEPESLDDDKKAAPYTTEELRAAAAQLRKLTDVGPRSLPPFEEGLAITHVVRRKDIVDLFDTTPDLAGADIDVSRFIRETDDHDVQVFWRDLAEGAPASDEKGPARKELCSVPVGGLRDWLKKGSSAWRWDHLGERWAKPDAIYPGLVLMLRADEGGYSADLGWTGKEKHTEPVVIASSQNESDGDDPHVRAGAWQTLAEHTDEVVAELERLLTVLPVGEPAIEAALRLAGRWHDAGKAHAVFQEALPNGASRDGKAIWAKSKEKMRRYRRPGFRHELASAISILTHGHSDLAAYLVAAHHGKVRLSIRSLPHEKHPPEPEQRFARGIWDGDALPAVDLGGGVTLPATTLDLSYMELGDGPAGPSWLARTLALRDQHGPFRLAFLEALLRVADWRASRDQEADHA